MLFRAFACLLLATPAAANPALNSAIDSYSQFSAQRDVAARIHAGLAVPALPSSSPASLKSNRQFAERLLATIAAIDPATLSESERLDLGALRHQLRTLAHEEADYAYSIPGPYSLWPLDIAGLALASNPLKTPADAAAYVSMIQSLEQELGHINARLAVQAERGIRVPRAQIPRALTKLDGIATQSANWANLPDERLAALSPAERDRLRTEAKAAAARIPEAVAAIRTSFSPAYLAAAPLNVGLAQYPGGKAHYEAVAALVTTLPATPAELAAIGRDGLARTNAELEAVATALGVPGGSAGIRRYAREDAQFRDATAEKVVERYNRCLALIEPNVPKFFATAPKAPYRAVPADTPGMTFGYYQQPSPTNAAGEYRFPASNVESRSQANACALIYHELIPGHHFQRAGALENNALPEFRRLAPVTAYVEGWGEYASRLAGRMGGYADPKDRLSRLMLDSMIYTRLVVDTGLNHEGWSFDQARSFMQQNTFLTDAEIESEVFRYGADIPAQALAYGAGSAALEQMRSEAEQALGSRFDIRKFHALVLDGGQLPMDVLRGHVRRGLGLPE
ncbi:DUF885 domain-containing protein [Sandaracinobacter neustonicus]|uniref:DUF885 domain-containing protein n=1 Tax=Sandaracinobacter neustonicus TaxID=1715348 RepID=A0A501XFR3_9SPHN|nr:DUF885 domain-containing protein [Sandaracinobacter neustonicus]TPE59239.1 DUF885 domain-containing protein [Sandaracinobacter neustonicus]